MDVYVQFASTGLARCARKEGIATVGAENVLNKLCVKYVNVLLLAVSEKFIPSLVSYIYSVALRRGLEPRTPELTARHSAIELAEIVRVLRDAPLVAGFR